MNPAVSNHNPVSRRWLRPLYAPPITRSIRAANEFHSGSATFTKREGIWSCTQFDPCLSFLRGMDPVSAKMDLIRRGFSWQWEEKSEKSVPSEGQHQTSSSYPETASPAQLERTRPEETSKASPPLDTPTGPELGPHRSERPYTARPLDKTEAPDGKLSRTLPASPPPTEPLTTAG